MRSKTWRCSVFNLTKNMFKFFFCAWQVSSVFTYGTSVYVTVGLNKPQMDLREHGEVPRRLTVYTGLHISALSEMLSRQLSQTKFITRFWSISNKFRSQTKQESNSVPTMCGHFAFSATPAHYLSRVLKRSRCSWVGLDSVPSVYPKK